MAKMSSPDTRMTFIGSFSETKSKYEKERRSMINNLGINLISPIKKMQY